MFLHRYWASPQRLPISPGTLMAARKYLHNLSKIYHSSKQTLLCRRPRAIYRCQAAIPLEACQVGLPLACRHNNRCQPMQQECSQDHLCIMACPGKMRNLLSVDFSAQFSTGFHVNQGERQGNGDEYTTLCGRRTDPSERLQSITCQLVIGC